MKSVSTESQSSCLCLQAEKAAPPTKFRKRRERAAPVPVLGAQAIQPKRILKPDPPKPTEVKPKTPEEVAEEKAKEEAIARSRKITSLYQKTVKLLDFGQCSTCCALQCVR